MNPRKDPGRSPGASQADQAVEGAQTASPPAALNAADSEERREDAIVSAEGDASVVEQMSASDSESASDSGSSLAASARQAPDRNSTSSEGSEDSAATGTEPSDSEDSAESDDSDFRAPRWGPLDRGEGAVAPGSFSAEVLRELIAAHGSPTRCATFYRYLLQAVDDGSADAVKTLLELGLNPNDPRSRFCDGSTPLHVAAFRGFLPILTRLLRHGARVDAVCKHQCTALHVAVISGHLHCAVTLMSAGAALHAKDVRGHTPLCYALYNGQLEALRAIRAFRNVRKWYCDHARESCRGEATSAHFSMLFFPRPN